MKLYKKNIAMLMAGLLALSSGSLVTSCDDDDDYDTNQFSSGSVTLTAASLQVTRGAYMTFKGTNLNRVTSVEFPGGVSSTPEVVDEHTIRALVPEGAEVGTVKLIYDGGELETKQIAFTEPITFDKFSPAEVTPGDELTITGTYLTYIDFVSFATGENVEVKNTNRTELKLNVPLDASTGKINLGYYSMDGKEIVETILESKEILKVAEPSELKITNPKVKAGENVVITGKLLRLVEYVSFVGADTTYNVAAKDPTKEVESISVPLPATAQNGDVTLTLFSGLQFVAGQIEAVVPTAAIKDKKESYGIGDIVTIEGENLDLIISGTFDGTAAGDTLANGAPVFVNKDGEISMTVTAAAKSGNITLSLANGITIPVEGFVTTKPVFTFPADATPLDVLEIESTLANRVTKVLFGELEAEASVSNDEKKFIVTVPLDAETGPVSYVMDNGETGAISDNFTVNDYTFCAVKDAAAFQAQNPTIGSLAAGVVVNAANLDNVQLNGKDTKFLLTGEMLYVYVGTVTGNQTVTLISGKTKVDYTVNVVANGIVETVIWNGPLEITWSDGGRVIVSASDLEGVPAGSTLRLYFNGKAGKWAQAQLNDGAFGSSLLGTLKPSDIPEYNWWNGGAAEEHVYEITLTADVLAHLRANARECEKVKDAALIIQGSDLIFSKVSVVVDYSAPKSIILAEGTDDGGWKLPVSLSWSNGGRLVVYKNNPVDLSSLVKVGATLYIVTSERHGQCQINNNSWTAIGTVADWDNYGEHTFEIPITQAYVDAFNNDGEKWIIIQGDSGFTITDMYIK